MCIRDSHPTSPLREAQQPGAHDAPEHSEDSATTAHVVVDSAADSAADTPAAVESPEQPQATLANCGQARACDTADVTTGAPERTSSTSTLDATGGESGTEGIAAQLRAAVAAGRGAVTRGSATSDRPSDAPIGFCFSFPMKQSGLTTCGSEC